MRYGKGIFVYNANAGENNTQQKLSQTIPVLLKAIKQLTVIQTESIEEARKTFAEHAAKTDIIIILGGDGTLHECINSIAHMNERPVLAILPGGTCNDFSRLLNIPQNLHQAAETIATGDVVDIDVGKTSEKYFLNFWGIGLVSEMSMTINEEQKKSPGFLSYVMSTLRTINQTHPFLYEITADNEQYEGEGVLILLLNGRFIGTRELPLPEGASPDDGKLDVLVIKNSNLALFRELLSLNRAEIHSQQLNELTHIQAENVKIKTGDKKAVDMDGEIEGSTPDEITILPNHIKMVKKSSDV